MSKRITSGKRAAPLKLDLGCGNRKEPGFLGVDLADLPGVDVLHDLRAVPWPWKDESIAEARCSHFLEHLTGSQRMEFMNELYRVLAVGATCLIRVPYWTSPRAIQDPTHQWPPLCEWSFLYFNKGWREQNQLAHMPITCDFDFSYGYELTPNMPFDAAQRDEQARHFGVTHYLNTVADLIVTITKRAP